jgi:hypothetical protein
MKQNAGIFPEYNSSGRDLIRSAITIDFLTTDTRHEFFIEISFLKSSGIWFIKYEKTMQSSRIRDTNKNSIYHLVFPSKDKTACEAA